MSDILFIILFIAFLLVTSPIWVPFAWMLAVVIIGAILAACAVLVAAIFVACSTLSKFCGKHLR